MEYEFSSSKVLNDIPVLPPLITSDIVTEIRYYKQLAVAVQERLKVLESRKKVVSEKCNSLSNNHYIPTNLINDKCRSCDQTTVTFGRTLVPAIKRDESACLINFNCDLNMKTIKSFITNTDQTCELTDKKNNFTLKQSQVEHYDNCTSNKSNSLMHKTLNESSSFSDTKRTSNNSYHLDLSVPIQKYSPESTLEKWKPQVPKSLDIVPIILDQSKSYGKLSISDESPKLLQRGSYIVHQTSPVHLAFIQNEIPSTDNKCTVPVQAVVCKEWNTSQIKDDLKASVNMKNSPQFNLSAKFQRNNFPNILCQRACKSVSNSQTGSPIDMYQTKSVDCIQTIFAEECYSSKAAGGRISLRKYSSAYTVRGMHNNSCRTFDKNISIHRFTGKLSEPFSSSNSAIQKSVKTSDNDLNLNTITNKNCRKNTAQNCITKKQKPIVTSEKIVKVFKEIQETHKKQILELMARQLKEQTRMQENFKKQQILLLAQIRKAFPEISISALTEAISSKGTELVPENFKVVKTKAHGIQNEQDNGKPEQNGTNYHSDEIHFKSVQCYNSSKEIAPQACSSTNQPAVPSISSYNPISCQPSQVFDEKLTIFSRHSGLSNLKAIDDIPVGTSAHRSCSVNRQLLPSDGKNNYSFVSDSTLYTENHMKAASIINAYARGFLVRRLMKSEKVIALKNTYREALHCMLKLHIDAPLKLAELNFHQRLQLQCDAASLSIVDLFSQSSAKRMKIIAHDREIKKARLYRPSSAHTYSFATQRTLARKKMKELGICPSLQNSVMSQSCPARTRCQTWTPNTKEKKITTSLINLDLTMTRRRKPTLSALADGSSPIIAAAAAMAETVGRVLVTKLGKGLGRRGWIRVRLHGVCQSADCLTPCDLTLRENTE
ncbi:uncharacterized protein LOC106641881 [Copidosoma floridanum]|uniref:uncharacterized protein LOC106641881 n=1 Tax=Copidosoma floridanum TaxID=29053 RepID=UPI0006C9C3AA|nr:uncharacterized protein LOC106641881 [Copidosoma floridanum]